MKVPSPSLGPNASALLNRLGRPGGAVDWTFVFVPPAFWAAKDPQHVALLSIDGAWTYADVESRTNQLTRTLISNGVKRGDRMAFVLPHCPETV
jgi:non-ribosomal peptide synthetase component F